MRRRLLLQRAAALALAAPWVVRARADEPAPTGGFETIDLDWTDAGRQRLVPVRL